jgi:hypothetical protein
MSSSKQLKATLLAMFPWVGGACVLSLAGLFLARQLIPEAQLRQSNDSVGNYLQTLGTIYAVLLAFVVFVVWQQFNDARGQVEREANELLDLIRTVRGLPDQIRARFLERAAGYVQVVLTQEWERMACPRDDGFEEGSLELERMWDLLVAYEPSSECHKSLYDEALARFNDLSDARVNRLNASRLRIPQALRLLLYAGAVATVASLYLFAVDSPVIHALMTATLASAIAHVLYVIHDLDDCFRGQWQVPRAPFQRVEAYLASARAASGSGAS